MNKSPHSAVRARTHRRATAARPTQPTGLAATSLILSQRTARPLGLRAHWPAAPVSWRLRNGRFQRSGSPTSQQSGSPRPSGAGLPVPVERASPSQWSGPPRPSGAGLRARESGSGVLWKTAVQGPRDGRCRARPLLLHGRCGARPLLLHGRCGARPLLLHARCGARPLLLHGRCRARPLLLHARCRARPLLLHGRCGARPLLLDGRCGSGRCLGSSRRVGRDVPDIHRFG
jgi:hypothetical protein